MSPPDDAATAYARDVTAGRALAGRLVRLACARHLADLEHGTARGLRFDRDRAQHALDFFRYLRLAEGEHADRPFVLQPWQQFIVGSLFGWLGADGLRRFRTAYVEVGKGNGKSPLAAAIGLYGLLADGESSAEVYSAATNHKQASILFRDAKNMVQKSPLLSRRLTVSVASIAHEPSLSRFSAVSSQHKGLDGKRVHMALIDELHEHLTSLVVDKMRAGTKGRRQALVLSITNAGHDRTSVCWKHHDYSNDVLTGKVENDSWFAYVCGLDACAVHEAEGRVQPVDGCEHCDDWRDERVWPKANPNLDVSVTRKYLREQVAEAVGMPSKEGLVKRLNLCWWTEGETTWLPAALWARGAGALDVPALAGRDCYGGLDLSSKIDLTAWLLAFPLEDGRIALLPRFFLPRETALARQDKDGVPYLVWERQGLITLTPGDVIDQDAIEEQVRADALTYRVVEVAYDAWNAAQAATHLQEAGLSLFEFRQSLRNFNEPTKLFESLLREGKLRHGSHPVLDWCAGNAAVITDASGNIRPVKPAHGSFKRVDGVVASVMALARAMLAPAPCAPSVEVW